MIVADTGCKNILVEGIYTTSVSRGVGLSTDGLTNERPPSGGVCSSQYGINARFQRRIILQSLLPEGGSLCRRK